jgi:hypothetical protein
MVANQLTLFVGDVTEDLGIAARAFDPLAYIIDSSNITNKHSGTAFVSIGDLLSVGEFFNLLSVANKIVYRPPQSWSDNKTSDIPYSMGWITEHHIRLASVLYNIITENVPSKVTGVSEPIARKTESQQLWFTGCSTTFGVGVGRGQRYQDIVRDNLSLESTDLSCPGSSISWSRDQILKSDVRHNDVVVWGLTSMARFSWFDNVTITHVVPSYYDSNPNFNKIVPITLLDAPQKTYEAISAIQQVNNFCNKIGAHLILINIHGNLDMLADCAKYKGFIMVYGRDGLDLADNFLDFGADNRHPGVKTHQYYAELIIKKINDLNIGINK